VYLEEREWREFRGNMGVTNFTLKGSIIENLYWIHLKKKKLSCLVTFISTLS
jgi:hypothetical protein